MKGNNLYLILVGILLLHSHALSNGDINEDLSHFIKDYRVDLDKTKYFYTHCKGWGVEDLAYMDGDKSISARFRFAIVDDMMIMDNELSKNRSFYILEKNNIRVSREPYNAYAFNIKVLNGKVDRLIPYLLDLNRSYTVYSDPIDGGEATILDFIDKPNSHVEIISSEMRSTNKYITLHSSIILNGILTEGIFKLSKVRTWRIDSYIIKRDRRTDFVAIQYKPVSHDVPVIYSICHKLNYFEDDNHVSSAQFKKFFYNIEPIYDYKQYIIYSMYLCLLFLAVLHLYYTRGFIRKRMSIFLKY
jgi:hypothetical protein